MKIMSLHQVISGRGGTETITQALDAGLSAKGHHVVTGLTGYPSVDRSWGKDLSDLRVGSAKDVVRLANLRSSVTVFHWLGDIFAEVQPDVAIVHDLALVPLTHWACRAHRLPIILYEHGILPQLNEFSWPYRRLYRHSVRKVNQILCGGSDYAEALGRTFHVSATAIGLPIQIPDAMIPRPSKEVQIVFVGRIENRQKRVDRLLRACASLSTRHWSLQIVGDGPDRQSMQILASQLGIADRCVWSGWQTDPWLVVESASLLAFPSAYEGFGATMVEAMAHGIPVLATDCHFGPRSVIRNNVNGWLVPETDTAFASALKDLVESPHHFPLPATVRSSVSDMAQDRWADRIERVCQLVVHSNGGLDTQTIK